MGFPGGVTHPEVVATIRQVIAKAKKAGLPVGMGMGNDAAFARNAIEMGVNWLQCGSDFSYMVAEADRLFAAVRAKVKSAP
jgi:2-keto-3-deoxy-L-rhamnonate aldolase RhmA